MTAAPARGFLIALEGVLVRDGAPLAGAVEALVRLRAMGIPFRILTGGSDRSAAEWSAWLLMRGFSVDPEEIWILDAPEALQRAARDLRLPPDAKVVLVGDAHGVDVTRVRQAGLTAVVIQAADAPAPGDVDAVATDLNGYLYRLFRIR